MNLVVRVLTLLLIVHTYASLGVDLSFMILFRAVFPDEHEVENGVEEGLLHPVEASDSKGGVIPVSAAAMMPSPVLLWRFKVGWDSVMRMSADKRELFLYEAFLYFNPLLLAALMVWLWGINLWFFFSRWSQLCKNI
ncbi:hypothetical protein HKD37_12G034880 [Glycine soja]